MAELKFALVNFIESDSVGIVELKDIETDHDRMSLNNDNWDSSVEVQVLWKIPGRSGLKKKEFHVAKILRFGGKMFFITKSLSTSRHFEMCSLLLLFRLLTVCGGLGL